MCTTSPEMTATQQAYTSDTNTVKPNALGIKEGFISAEYHFKSISRQNCPTPATSRMQKSATVIPSILFTQST